MKLIRKYINYFLKNFDIKSDETQPLQFWRDRLFAYLVLVIAPIGLIVYIPSIMLLIQINSLIMAVTDTYALIIVLIVFFNKKLSIKNKKTHFFLAIYLMGGAHLYSMGINGTGLVYLIGFSLLVMLVYETKYGYLSVIVNFFLTFLPIISLYNGDYTNLINQDFGVFEILLFSANFWFVNIVLIVGLAIMLEGLQKSIAKEQELKLKLEAERANLEKAKFRAEESDRLKSAFLANMSHEIRTPMNSIIGFTSILNDNLSDEEKKEYIKIITKNSKYLLKLINDIIDLSKIESGAVNIVTDPINIKSFIEDIYKYCEEKGNDNIDTSIEINLGISEINVFADKVKITQILRNFLSNAYKFTEQGRITLSVAINDEGEYVFSVKDTGIGIAVENIRNIFERFYQIDEYIDGAGLGQTICKLLTETLNGRINVKSEINNGSVFELILNLKTIGIITEKAEMKTIEKINANIKILVVEDQEDNYFLLKTALKHFGYQCEHSENGLDAVERAKKTNFDIILMDLKLPLLNGIQAT